MLLKKRYSQMILYLIITIQMLIPRGFNLKYIAITGLFIYLTKGKIKISKLFTAYGLVYSITSILTYFIHFYLGSLWGIVFFVVNFIIIRYCIVDKVETFNDFKQLIHYIEFVLFIYSVLCLVETFSGFNIFDVTFRRSFDIVGANGLRFGLQRAHGACTVSINNGMILAFGWALSAYQLYNTNKRNRFMLIRYIVIGAASILNLSRAIIFVGVLIQIVLLVKCGRNLFVKRLVVILASVVVLWPFIGDKFTVLFQNFRQLMLSALSFLNPSYNEYVDIAGNIGTQGSRFELWGWVYEAVKDRIILGNGFERQLGKAVLWSTGNGYSIKDSIEVQWLRELFRGGLFMLFGFITYQIGCLKILLKKNINKRENVLSFRAVGIVTTISYFIALFTFSGLEDLNFFYIFMALYETYYNICKNKARYEKLYA